MSDRFQFFVACSAITEKGHHICKLPKDNHKHHLCACGFKTLKWYDPEYKEKRPVNPKEK